MDFSLCAFFVFRSLHCIWVIEFSEFRVEFAFSEILFSAAYESKKKAVMMKGRIVLLLKWKLNGSTWMNKMHYPQYNSTEHAHIRKSGLPHNIPTLASLINGTMHNQSWNPSYREEDEDDLIDVSDNEAPKESSMSIITTFSSNCCCHTKQTKSGLYGGY
jgi:hypothetical protein